ncbi:MAG: TolC family protein [Bacteroidales bacterium]
MNIKKVLSVTAFLALTVVASASTPESESALKLTLEDALRIALTESPTIEIANQQIVSKRFARREAQSGLYPSISGSVQYSRTLKKQKFVFGDDPSGGVEVGTSNQYTAGLNISLPLVVPTLWKSIQITKLDIENAEELARESGINLAQAVKDAYYSVLLAEESLDALTKNYDQALANAEMTKLRFQQGVVSEYDWIRAQVQVKNLEPNLFQAESGVALSKLRLVTLLGLEDQEITLLESLDSATSQMYSEAMAQTQDTLSNNTTLRQLDIQKNILQKTLKMQHFAHIPTLAASFSYSQMAMDNSFNFKSYNWFPFSTLGVTLSIPIFDGGSRYYKAKQTRVGLSTLELQRLDVERNLKTQLRSARDQVNRSIKQVSSAEGSVEMAQKGVDIARRRYDTGMGTFIELNDAEVALLQSELTFNQALYEYVSAKSALENLTGTFNLQDYITKETTK